VFGEHIKDLAAGGGHERTTMRRRLRKKRRLGEFRENIFGVRFSLRDGLPPGTDDEFLWRFLEGAVEAKASNAEVAVRGQRGSSVFSWRDEAAPLRHNDSR
jgi:uncharacterized protein YggL (DUF469 family)